MKRVLTGIIFILMATATVYTQAKGQTTDVSEVRHAIDKGNAQWIAAWEKGDAAMIADIFAENGVQLTSSGKVLKGRQQILEGQKTFMQSVDPGTKVTVTTVTVWLDGDAAYETGKYKYEYKRKGTPGTDEGRYVTIWKRQRNSSWKLFMDMGVPQDVSDTQK